MASWAVGSIPSRKTHLDSGRNEWRSALNSRRHDAEEPRRRPDTGSQDGTTSTVATGPAGTPAINPHSDSWLGEVVGHYRLLGRVGQGGMGTVTRPFRRRSVQERWRSRCCVSAAGTPPESGFAQSDRPRFTRHPHICRLLDGGSWIPPGAHGGQPFIVMNRRRRAVDLLRAARTWHRGAPELITRYAMHVIRPAAGHPPRRQT